MYDFDTLALVTLVFLLAGTVKGVIGLGLPTVSLGLLTATLDLTTAMALLVVPSFCTNLWQALDGPATRVLLRRIGVFLACATLTVWIGGLALGHVDTAFLSALLGVLLALYAGLSLSGRRLAISVQREPVVGPLLGGVNGVLTGLTGSFVVPGVMYLQGIGLTRDELIQAMGMLFTLSTLALAISLGSHDLLDRELGITSILALAPAIVGMQVGRRLRRRIPEARFRRIFFLAVLIMGAYILLTSVVGFSRA